VSWRSCARNLLLRAGRRLTAAASARRVVVLCYHSVHPSSAASSATPQLFLRHLAWLHEHYDVIPFRQALAATQRKTNRPAVSITFDDGFADNYEYAYPLLRRYRIPATFFLTAGFLDRDRTVLHRLQRAWRIPAGEMCPLEWAQVREMRRGGMDFGAHSYGHANLAELPRSAVEADVRRAKDTLEERLSEPITSMAYPFGKPRRHFTRRTVEAVANAGYEYAGAIVCRRVRAGDSPLVIPRFYITHDDLPTLIEKVSGAWDLWGYCQERAPAALREEAAPHPTRALRVVDR
jgi:peptidoglycan/xylan/chitin deacetylase (PgdA/CDA1 family)